MSFLPLVLALTVLIAGSSCSATRPTTFVFITQPAGAIAGMPFSMQPAVCVIDDCGCIATGYTGAVTLSITSGTGTKGAVLSGTATVDPFYGIATFSGLSIDTPGVDYSLTATSGNLSPASSNPFDVITPAPANPDIG